MDSITFTGGRRRMPPASKVDLAAEMRTDPTPGEAALWAATKDFRRTTRLNRQQVIRGFIADFYLPAQRAIVEVDGGYHEDDDQAERDARRDELFRGWGYSILRVQDALVLQMPAVCVEILSDFVDQIGEHRFSPGSMPTWDFFGYGLLSYWDRESRRRVVEHWFQGNDAPDDVLRSFGEDGPDFHPLSDCAASRCATWAVR